MTPRSRGRGRGKEKNERGDGRTKEGRLIGLLGVQEVEEGRGTDKREVEGRGGNVKGKRNGGGMGDGGK